MAVHEIKFPVSPSRYEASSGELIVGGGLLVTVTSTLSETEFPEASVTVITNVYVPGKVYI